MSEAFICDSCETPIGRFEGGLIAGAPMISRRLRSNTWPLDTAPWRGGR